MTAAAVNILPANMSIVHRFKASVVLRIMALGAQRSLTRFELVAQLPLQIDTGGAAVAVRALQGIGGGADPVVELLVGIGQHPFVGFVGRISHGGKALLDCRIRVARPLEVFKGVQGDQAVVGLGFGLHGRLVLKRKELSAGDGSQRRRGRPGVGVAVVGSAGVVAQQRVIAPAIPESVCRGQVGYLFRVWVTGDSRGVGRAVVMMGAPVPIGFRGHLWHTTGM